LTYYILYRIKVHLFKHLTKYNTRKDIKKNLTEYLKLQSHNSFHSILNQEKNRILHPQWSVQKFGQHKIDIITSHTDFMQHQGTYNSLHYHNNARSIVLLPERASCLHKRSDI
jgi:hypothetical protein